MTGRVRSIISKYSDHIALPVEIEKREEKDGETVISWEKNQQSAGAVDS
ncbi:chaperone (heat shock protein) [Escherichia coli]|uniref:Chaperone (Heat shock protein) n=1 Tax=Escherichia coli TaxID=562 RepID=A0A376KYX2_ECOLX|nr:chaperone (heat shock protein) [Escherichia coli]